LIGNLLHRRPVLPLLIQTSRTQQPQRLHRLQLNVGAPFLQRRIHRLHQPLFLYHPLHINHQIHILLLSVKVDRFHGRQNLNQHHAEAIDIALIGQLKVPVVLGIDVPQRPLRAGEDVAVLCLVVLALFLLHQPREPEVGDLGVELLVEQDVARLHVAVVDGGHGSRVEVGEALGGLVRDAEAADPADGLELLGAVAVEVVEEGAVGDELGDEEGLVELDAAAQEAHQAAVVHLAEDPDLVQDLVNPFGVPELGALDGRDGSVVEGSLEDLAEAARADEVGLGEVVRCLGYLFPGEDSGRFAACFGVEAQFSLFH
ncbi:hypothetical protein PanWU01x14_156260, partial [Parasponia andersonii]